MFCTNCGSKLPEGARFCSTCGTRVAEAFEVPAVENKPADTGFVAKAPEAEADKPYEAPLKKRVTFDWSNVIDEPIRKTIPDIKSPWTSTGSFNEKELYTEMGKSTGRSRTMSFIDVLKAEKEEQAKDSQPAEQAKPEERPIEYTEVLDPGYLAGDILEEKKPEDAAPVLHFAPLYEDLDEPVVTPFDIPEEKQEPEPEPEAAPAEEVPAVSEISIAAPESEPEAEEPVAEEVIEEAPAIEEPVVLEPSVVFEEPVYEEPAFEEVVEEAPVVEEPVALEPVFEEPVVEEEPARRFGGWFDLPDFLKPKAKAAAVAEEPAAPEPVIEEVIEETPAAEEPEFELELEEPVIEEVPEEEPVFEEVFAEEPVFEEPVFEETAEEPEVEEEPEAPAEPSADADVVYESDLYSSTEDEYLNIDTERNPEFSRATMSFEMPEDEEVEEEEEEEEEACRADGYFLGRACSTCTGGSRA